MKVCGAAALLLPVAAADESLPSRMPDVLCGHNLTTIRIFTRHDCDSERKANIDNMRSLREPDVKRASWLGATASVRGGDTQSEGWY